MLFVFFSIILSVSKDDIKHFLNVTVGICVVYPDNSKVEINQTTVNYFKSRSQGQLNFSTCSYSNYSLSDKSTLSTNHVNYVITRDEKFLELYKGGIMSPNLSDEVNQAFYSYVEVLNESTLDNFTEDSVSLFLLTGPSIIKEFEDAAFFYRKTKARFGFLYKNSSDTFVSLQYIKNKHNVTRFYDNTVPIIQFIRSCKVEKSQIFSDQINQAKMTTQKHSANLFAITDNFTEEVKSAFEYINSTKYGPSIDFEVISWDNSTELKKKCKIKKPESNLTYVMFFNTNSEKETDNECYVFQDMDFYSKELISFFISKVFQYNSSLMKLKLFPVQLLMTSSQQSISTFSNYVPGKNLAFVLLESKSSYSLFEAKLIFNVLKNEFNELRLTGNLNGTLKNVDFYKFEYNLDNFKMPSADFFPTFVIYEPFNSQAHVFNQIVTIESIRSWILEFATKKEIEDEEEFNEDENSQINSNSAFFSFIKDLSHGKEFNRVSFLNPDSSPTNSHTNDNDDIKSSSNEPTTTTTPDSHSEESNEETEKVRTNTNSNINLMNFFNNLGFDDFEIELSAGFDDNKASSHKESTFDIDEIKELIKKEVRNVFEQEKPNMMSEIVNDILHDIIEKINSMNNLIAKLKSQIKTYQNIDSEKNDEIKNNIEENQKVPVNEEGKDNQVQKSNENKPEKVPIKELKGENNSEKVLEDNQSNEDKENKEYVEKQEDKSSIYDRIYDEESEDL